MLSKHFPHVHFLILSSGHFILHLSIIFELECNLLVSLKALLLAFDHVCSKLLSLIREKCEDVVACSHCRIYILVSRPHRV